MDITLDEVLSNASRSHDGLYVDDNKLGLVNIPPTTAAIIRNKLREDYIPIPQDKDGIKIDKNCMYYGADGRDWFILGFARGRYNVIGQHEDQIQPLRAKWLSRNNQKPKMLDADGTCVEVGHELYLTEKGRRESGIKTAIEPFVVLEIKSSNCAKASSYTEGMSSKAYWLLESEWVTHSEPDSLEKLRNDIAEFSADGTYHGAIDAFLQRCEDRLTAIMEREKHA